MHRCSRVLCAEHDGALTVLLRFAVCSGIALPPAPFQTGDRRTRHGAWFCSGSASSVASTFTRVHSKLAFIPSAMRCQVHFILSACPRTHCMRLPAQPTISGHHVHQRSAGILIYLFHFSRLCSFTVFLYYIFCSSTQPLLHIRHALLLCQLCFIGLL